MPRSLYLVAGAIAWIPPLRFPGRARMRFLHLADLHLDTPFAGRGADLRARLREATREALLAAVEAAIGQQVDAVLIAGDLFDGERLSLRTERFLLEALERLDSAGIPVVYATGNHDPGDAAGAAARIGWPGSVTVLTGPEPRRVPIERDGRVVGWVTGAGHPTAHVEEDLSRRFPAPEGPLPEVALLHTQVLGSRGEGGHDRYAPSTLGHLRSSGYDYWALGHIHLPQELSADPPVHYAGSLQGRHPGEAGPRGGLLVELARGAPARVRFVELAPLRWETLEVEGLGSIRSLEALARAVDQAWASVREADPGRPGTEWLLRVELTGPAPLHRALADPDERAEVERELRDTLGLLEAEVRAGGVHPPLDPAEHRGRSDVLGEALQLLEAIEKGEAALDMAPDELAALPPGAEAGAYVRGLLRAQAPSLLAALLEEGGAG